MPEICRHAIEHFRDRLAQNPQNAGWYGWYAILRSDGSAPSVLVGAGGFFGPPTEDQVVEIGYSIMPSFQGRGLATELVRALVEHGFSTAGVLRVVAHTTPENAGSVRVLEKAGFRLAGPGKEAGSVQYECGRQGQGPLKTTITKEDNP